MQLFIRQRFPRRRAANGRGVFNAGEIRRGGSGGSGGERFAMDKS